jgi:hypothetical protein
LFGCTAAALGNDGPFLEVSSDQDAERLRFVGADVKQVIQRTGLEQVAHQRIEATKLNPDTPPIDLSLEADQSREHLARKVPHPAEVYQKPTVVLSFDEVLQPADDFPGERLADEELAIRETDYRDPLDDLKPPLQLSGRPRCGAVRSL